MLNMLLFVECILETFDRLQPLTTFYFLFLQILVLSPYILAFNVLVQSHIAVVTIPYKCIL
jgi:hypothetical protein